MSLRSIFKTIFWPINKAVDWITADDEKLRQARTRAMTGRGPLERPTKGKKEKDRIDFKEEEEDREEFSHEYDVWEEIDSYRTTFWFGSKLGKYMSRSRKSDLREKLEALEKKRAEDERKKEEGGE
jgi:hypothetical protein